MQPNGQACPSGSAPLGAAPGVGEPRGDGASSSGMTAGINRDHCTSIPSTPGSSCITAAGTGTGRDSIYDQRDSIKGKLLDGRRDEDDDEIRPKDFGTEGNPDARNLETKGHPGARELEIDGHPGTKNPGRSKHPEAEGNGSRDSEGVCEAADGRAYQRESCSDPPGSLDPRGDRANPRSR